MTERDISEDLREAIEESSFMLQKDNESPWGQKLNEALEKAGRPEGFIRILIEDQIIAEGVWSPEEAHKIADRISIYPNADKSEDFFVPQNEDYVGIFGDETGTEVFMANHGAVEVLLQSGIFKKSEIHKDRYLLDSRATPDHNFSVEMSYKASKEPKRDSVTLWFF